MEDAVCIDTDFLIDLLREKEEAVSWFKNNEDNFKLATTTINLFELYYGAHKSIDAENNILEVDNLIDGLTILNLDSESAREAAKQFSRLSSEGNIMDIKDIFIGSIALTSKYKLKTHNKKDFERIKGLKVI